MGDGFHGDAGRDHGVRYASLPGHNAHANGQARDDRGHRTADGCAPRLLSDARNVVQPHGDPDEQRRVRLGRGDPGARAVGLLLRVHTHALARRRAVPEIRRQTHDGHRHTVHRSVYADHPVRGQLRVHGADRPAIHRRPRRSKSNA